MQSIGAVANMWGPLLLVLCACGVNGKLDEDEDNASSGDHDLDDSMEKIGATVSQVYQHPYAATLNKNDTYLCSAVVLNTYWVLTLSKCFGSGIITSYVTHKNLSNFTVRAGSSYNNKGGALHKIKMLINNFDLRVSAIKLEDPMVFSSQVQNVRLPDSDADEVSLGFLATIIAWTPSGHMRVVNAPVIDPEICEANTKMLPGHYVCVGGVQDPNRHFCRRDNGGAVIQNNTLVAISSFINSCALYSKTHAFPKVSSFVRWLNTIIWDEDIRPTTTESPTTVSTVEPTAPTSTKGPNNQPYFNDPARFMLTLPFDPVNVPIEPSLDNSVLPGMSLYEAYLQSIAKSKTSTTEGTSTIVQKVDAKQAFNNPMMLRQNLIFRALPKIFDRNEYH